jgi:hypothetical protein
MDAVRREAKRSREVLFHRAELHDYTFVSGGYVSIAETEKAAETVNRVALGTANQRRPAIMRLRPPVLPPCKRRGPEIRPSG